MAGFRCVKENFYRERFNDDKFKTKTSKEQNKIEDSIQLLYEHFRSEAQTDPEICTFLKNCQHPDGGFGGGPMQVAHLAATYAAVCALVIIGTDEAYEVIDRKKLGEYLSRMKQPEGSFKMHDYGEADIRGAYCAATVASLTNIYTQEMFDGTSEWIMTCQTYEGGFAGISGMEAHGGYTFCGLATLLILGKEKLCDVNALLKWAVNRQMRFEGGFQGRTNKLVDGCYSFWQGGLFPLIHRILVKTDSLTLGLERWLFHQGALQEYLLICCQTVNGGLIDKPGKNRDYYHTCYTLSGLSVAQHFAGGKFGSTWISGDAQNELIPIHPIYNICVDSVVNAHEFFSNLPSLDELDKQAYSES
uniref:Protein farnesyltransferase subunit beta n=1 Tax=Strigamia maritima TaxID=126957 RepID=T1IU12_STRMM